MTVQLAIRVEDEMAAGLDALVPERYANRTEAIRAALAEFIERERRAEIGRRIVAGYERVPAGELSDAVASAASKLTGSIEPWDWSEE
jgi:Arc/MetJ-type ribon-helix-helix transcriptional regulator